MTRRQFETFVVDVGYKMWSVDGEKEWKMLLEVSPTAEHPANNILWEDAVKFCNWLSKREGFEPYYEVDKRLMEEDDTRVWHINRFASGYRLPTEAEWELACRATSTAWYYFGDDESLATQFVVCMSKQPEPVSSRAPNGWGFFDMHGNIAEWTNDRYREFEQDTQRSIVDPDGPETGRGRVLRGGAFGFGPLSTNSTSRFDSRNRTPPSPEAWIGFRIARNHSK